MERPSAWNIYHEKTKEAPPHESLVEAVKLVSEREVALDLGAGALRDTKYLLQAGFKRVIAVDAEPINKSNEVIDERLEIVVSSFETFELPENAYDLVNAQYSLPFASPDSFDEVFKRMQSSLKQGGIFVGQLFGKNDDWANRSNMTFHSLEEVQTLLSGMHVLNLREEEQDGPTAAGPTKHWHVFHITARK